MPTPSVSVRPERASVTPEAPTVSPRPHGPLPARAGVRRPPLPRLGGPEEAPPRAGGAQRCGAEGFGPDRLRERGLGADGRGGACAAPGRTPRSRDTPGAGCAAPGAERGPPRRRQRPRNRAGFPPVPRPALGGGAKLPLPDRAETHGLRQALRLVDPRPPRPRPHAGGGAPRRGDARLPLLLRR